MNGVRKKSCEQDKGRSCANRARKKLCESCKEEVVGMGVS